MSDNFDRSNLCVGYTLKRKSNIHTYIITKTSRLRNCRAILTEEKYTYEEEERPEIFSPVKNKTYAEISRIYMHLSRSGSAQKAIQRL
jgi:hypothetical protein